MFKPVIFLNFFAFGCCFMTVLWLEIHDVFFSYFLLFDSVTFGVTAFKGMSTRKSEIIPGFPFHVIEINSKHQSSFLFRLKVELMLLLAILSFEGIFSCLPLIEFTGRWSYCNMKRNNKFIDI